MAQRVDELAADAAELIRGQVAFHAGNDLVSDEDLRETLRSNLLAALSQLGAVVPSIDPGRIDLSRARTTGQRRAAAGVPLPAVMDGYRVGVQFLWQAIVAQAHANGAVTAPTSWSRPSCPTSDDIACTASKRPSRALTSIQPGG